jgi:AAHS family 4-hydroxybenzoate transporter-like MFS transporter
MNSARRSSHRGIVAICFAAAMVDGFDTLVVAFIAPALAQTWSLAPTQVGAVFGAGLLGAALGGFSIGPAADRYGRRTMLLVCVVLFALFTLACVWADGWRELAIYRFIGGLGLGGAIPNITALTAEHTPPERRSSMVTTMFVGFPLGAVIGGAVTAWLLTRYDWQAAFWLGGLLPLLLLPAIWLGVPESLRRAGQPVHSALSWRRQWQDGRGAASVLLWLGVFSVMLVSYFLINWTPTVLVDAGFSDARAAMGAVLLNLGGVVGALVIARLVDRHGPFRPVASALLIGAVCIVVLGRHPGGQWGTLVWAFVTGGFMLGGQLNIPAMAARLYPPQVRGAGVGWTMGMGRLGSIAGPTIGGALLAREPALASLFLAAAAPAVLAAIFIVAVERTRPRD